MREAAAMVTVTIPRIVHARGLIDFDGQAILVAPMGAGERHSTCTHPGRA